MRKLVLFGNGLGRALDPEFFQLEKALSFAWKDAGVLDGIQKSLITQCLPDGVIEQEFDIYPSSEGDLDKLQRVLAACDEIRKFEISGRQTWLNEHGSRFPIAIRSFLHASALYFHTGGHVLPAEFTTPLVDWLGSSKSHVATLNYDDLLYRSFIGTGLFIGYSGLIDGFVPNFEQEKLNRWYPHRQSFYLHLHGSPLYYSDQHGNLWKSSLSELPALQGYSTSHVVLTHVDHKSTVINASPILREYWIRLEEPMREVDAIILFGYGGADRHPNALVSKYFLLKQVEIVERRHESYASQEGINARCSHWQSVLGVEKVYAFWHDNILKHSFWNWERPKA